MVTSTETGSFREAHATRCRYSMGAHTHLRGQERVDRQKSKKEQNPQVRTKKLEGEKKRKGNYHRRRKELQHRRETTSKRWSRRFECGGLRSVTERKIESKAIKTRNSKDFCHHTSIILSFMKILWPGLGTHLICTNV